MSLLANVLQWLSCITVMYFRIATLSLFSYDFGVLSSL